MCNNDNNSNDKLEIIIPADNSMEIHASAKCQNPRCQTTFKFHCVKPGREGYSNGRSGYFGKVTDLMENVVNINQSRKPGVLYDVNLKCPYCGKRFDVEISTE